MENLLSISTFLFIVTVVYYLYRRLQIVTMKSRQRLFDDCSLLLDNAQKSYDKNGFPILKGRYEGFNIQLDLIPDTIVMRKIPPLWLMVTIRANKQSEGSLDFIVRPQNTEFYSPGWQWNGQYEIPINWPQHAIAKYKRARVSIKLLDQYLPKLFENIKVKQLLITPRIVRVTYMAKQAIRGEYLLMRGAIFDDFPIDKQEMKVMIEQALLIRKNLEDEVA